jgi:hypothetical protein
MSKCRSLMSLAPNYRIGAGLALALFAAGCSDQIGPEPTAVQEPAAPAPHFVRWAGPIAPQFRVIDAQSGEVLNRVLLTSASSALGLEQYTATFWAVSGEERSVEIDYLSSGGTSSPFLGLAGVDPAYVPGRGDLAPGDSVMITVTIDPYNVGVSLEPTGLLVGGAAQLQIGYGGAGGDLNGDGVVDGTDAYIESQRLGISYRPAPYAPWIQAPAVQSLPEASFITPVLQFSQFAVSW